MPSIQSIRAATLKNAPYFFDKPTLKFFGQTLGSFKVKESPRGNVYIFAKMFSPSGFCGFTFRRFTGDDLVLVPEFQKVAAKTSRDVLAFIREH